MKTQTATYLQWQGLEQLKQQPVEQAVEQAAEQFEALFLQQVLKQMRSASDALRDPDGPFAPGPREEMMRDWYDGQIAVDLASRGQTGLKGLLVEQLSGALKNSGAAVVASGETPIAAFSQPLRTHRNG
ncbi:peptidoglycan hydrolase [Zobellella denitrificans]|jgi:peptidoglycan hydrolase FlgJ|uniref:rod-binding protein n=1 Tax=Zobellella denitrificans TaxID=347534 RepID=UPI000B8BE5E4|nr:rod-binding protein [Zobellella denitrificans]OXS14256.1 peptidoglycan hydrolase [Zobellella denitrificans]